MMKAVPKRGELGSFNGQSEPANRGSYGSCNVKSVIHHVLSVPGP